MDTNVYSPPKSDITVSNSEPGSIAKAVIISSLIDIVGSVTSGLILVTLYGVYLASHGASQKDIENAFANLNPYSALGIIGSTLGALISVYAGYKCAKICNNKSYKATSITAATGVAFGLLVGSSAYSISENIVLSALTIVSIFLGSWLFQRKFQEA